MQKLPTKYSCAICGKVLKSILFNAKIHKISLANVKVFGCKVCITNKVAADFLKV